MGLPPPHVESTEMGTEGSLYGPRHRHGRELFDAVVGYLISCPTMAESLLPIVSRKLSVRYQTGPHSPAG